MWRLPATLATTCLGVLSCPWIAGAQSYQIDKAALIGDTAPGSGGGTYSGAFFGSPDLGAARDVVWFTQVTGATVILNGQLVSLGVFADTGGTDRAVALNGGPTPDGGTYVNFPTFPSVNSAGDIAFVSETGVYVDSGGTQSSAALAGDPAPGTGGGGFSTFHSGFGFAGPSIDDSGDVAFFANLIGGTASAGIFLNAGGTVSDVALVGDTAPGTGGGTYSGFGQVPIVSLVESGDVAFYADVTGGTVSQGIFVASGTTDRAVALVGEPAPGTGGGTYSNVMQSIGFGLPPTPRVNASGDVAFYAQVSGGTAGDGIFVDSGGTDRAVALAGGQVPGAGAGVTYSSFPAFVSMNDAGDVAFTAGYSAAPSGGVLVESGGVVRRVAELGDVAPGTGGGTYTFLNGLVAINEAGDVSFSMSTTAGLGYFVARKLPVAPVPTLSPRALALASVLLLAAGAGVLAWRQTRTADR